MNMNEVKYSLSVRAKTKCDSGAVGSTRPCQG